MNYSEQEFEVDLTKSRELPRVFDLLTGYDTTCEVTSCGHVLGIYNPGYYPSIPLVWIYGSVIFRPIQKNITKIIIKGRIYNERPTRPPPSYIDYVFGLEYDSGILIKLDDDSE
jgi:hypothetical protein